MVLDKFINPLNKKFFSYLANNNRMNHFVTTNKYTKKVAKNWIAGETSSEAFKTAEKLTLEGRLVTLDHLGENVTNAKDAKSSARDYNMLLVNIAFKGLNSTNVSLKLTQMGLDIDEDLCYDNVADIAQTAKIYKNFVRIDMEGSDYTQKTIDMYKRLKKNYENIGIVIQSCLHRSEEDIDDLLKLDTNFRLCKGAYREPPSIAFPNKKDVDKNFVKITEKLLLSGTYQAFATHDEKIIEHIKSFAKNKGINEDNFEFQMLHGVRKKLQQKIVDEGYQLRVYVPYGEDWYPYTMRRFAESYHNVWFILKNMFE